MPSKRAGDAGLQKPEFCVNRVLGGAERGQSSGKCGLGAELSPSRESV